MTKHQKLSRQETHDLSMIIKDRSKVLKAEVGRLASRHKADFEAQLATSYKWEEDDIWKEATEKAMEIVAQSQQMIEQRCLKLGIPVRYAPRLGISWQGRGENALNERRAELRRVAEAQNEAMAADAMVKIEKQSLDLRTQVVAMGVLSDNAKVFLESLAPVEEAMRALEFSDVEKRLDAKNADMRRMIGRNGGT
jgi:hypothetical protein